MPGEDIRIANNVRQILGRHYIKARAVRIIVGRGAVRILGKLERTEAKTEMPIDKDYVNKLKREILRVQGVKIVAITIPEEEKKDIPEEKTN
jgi:hypothetical protein